MDRSIYNTKWQIECPKLPATDKVTTEKSWHFIYNTNFMDGVTLFLVHFRTQTFDWHVSCEQLYML